MDSNNSGLNKLYSGQVCDRIINYRYINDS